MALMANILNGTVRDDSAENSPGQLFIGIKDRTGEARQLARKELGYKEVASGLQGSSLPESAEKNSMPPLLRAAQIANDDEMLLLWGDLDTDDDAFC